MAGTKLTDLAKKFVIEGILEGQTNYEILGRMEAIGIQCNLTQQALSYYRSLPQVRATIAMWEREALQSGLARRGARMQKLNDIAESLEAHMMAMGAFGGPRQASFFDGKGLQVLDRYLKVMQMVQSLVGSAERRDARVDPDVELAQLQRRRVGMVNPWYSAEEAIGEAGLLELDDPDCPELEAADEQALLDSEPGTSG